MDENIVAAIGATDESLAAIVAKELHGASFDISHFSCSFLFGFAKLKEQTFQRGYLGVDMLLSDS
jgi:hypothetical protein